MYDNDNNGENCNSAIMTIIILKCAWVWWWWCHTYHREKCRAETGKNIPTLIRAATHKSFRHWFIFTFFIFVVLVLWCVFVPHVLATFHRIFIYCCSCHCLAMNGPCISIAALAVALAAQCRCCCCYYSRGCCDTS